MSKNENKKLLGLIPIKPKDYKVDNNEEFKKILKGEEEREEQINREEN